MFLAMGLNPKGFPDPLIRGFGQVHLRCDGTARPQNDLRPVHEGMRHDTRSGKRYKLLMNSTRQNRLAEATDFYGDLDTVAREGAHRMLVSILDAEVTEFLW